MRTPSVSPGVARWLGLGAVVATVGLAIVLRLVDPLSSAVIPAEDPYTHMVLVGEHLRTGTLDALNPPGDLYPPGMHAFVASVFAFTGLDLYTLFRFGPVALGAIGVAGMAALLWRDAGPIAGVVGALAYAVAPEVIFRTTMMSPTALDLALLPFLLLTLIEIARGQLGWIAAAAPMVLFVVFAHPWLLGILSAGAITLALLAIVLPWPTTRAPRPSATGLASILAMIGGGLGLAATSCGGMCGPGFAPMLPEVLAHSWVGPAIIAVSATPLAATALARGHAQALVDRLTPTDGGDRLPRWGKLVTSAFLLAALAAVTWPALQQGMPRLVDLPRMFGWPILATAALGLAALPFIASPTAHLATGLALFTYPMVIFNPLASPFWPHRTAVFLGVALVILVGLTAHAMARWATRALDALRPALPKAERWRAASSLVLVPALVVTAGLGGAVYAGTPDAYDGGWYRLYEPCEFDALRDVADRIEDVPEAVLVTGSWQSRLVAASFHDDATRVWASPAFFWSETDRDATLGGFSPQERPLFVLVDRHLASEHPDADTGFLEGPAWETAGSWCKGQIATSDGIQLYRYTGGQA